MTGKTTKKSKTTKSKKKSSKKSSKELQPVNAFDHFVENPHEIEGALDGMTPQEKQIFRQALSNAEKNKSRGGSRRMLERTQLVYHDLYKLLPADTIKKISPVDPTLSDEQNDQAYPPEWRTVPHKHFYHTTNSDGKKQIYCAPAAGHFHEVTTHEDEDGNLTAECGPPLVMSRGKVCGYKNDKHIHEVEYMESEQITKRVRSKEAAKMMTAISAEETNALKGSAGAYEK